jgi:ElaA protein
MHNAWNFKCVAFKDLSLQQLYAVLKARQEVFAVEQNIVYQDCDDKDLTSLHLFVEDEKQIIAYARLLPKGISYENYCSIGRVLVLKEFRTQLLGKALMIEAIKMCKEKFGGSIKISAQLYLERFYNELGFATISEPYIEEDILHIGMLHK